MRIFVVAAACAATFLIGYLLATSPKRAGFSHTYVSVLNEIVAVNKAPYHD